MFPRAQEHVNHAQSMLSRHRLFYSFVLVVCAATITLSAVAKDRRDADGDGIPDHIEQRTGTDPLQRDSDADGVPDGQEDIGGKATASKQNASETGPVVRFFQLTLIVMYCSSGVCKARNDWFTTPYLLFTHLHGSYQTGFTHFMTNFLPAWSWNVFQGGTLIFEVFAPLWFVLKRTRPVAFAWGLAMHGMIGLMFGPVIWFSLLMASLLVACFAPLTWLDRTVGRIP